MIARAMKLTGLDTNVSGVDAVSVLSSFVDGAAVDAWAKQAAASCSEERAGQRLRSRRLLPEARHHPSGDGGYRSADADQVQSDR